MHLKPVTLSERLLAVTRILVGYQYIRINFDVIGGADVPRYNIVFGEESVEIELPGDRMPFYAQT